MTSVDVSDLRRSHLREKRPEDRQRRIRRELIGRCLRRRWENRRHLRGKRPEERWRRIQRELTSRCSGGGGRTTGGAEGGGKEGGGKEGEVGSERFKKDIDSSAVEEEPEEERE